MRTTPASGFALEMHMAHSDNLPTPAALPAQGRYYEDFTVGQQFTAEEYELGLDELLAFARAYDAQPFHVDEQAACDSMFDGFVAGGWHATAITMALTLRTQIRPALGFVGLCVEDLRWWRPVRAGDRIRLLVEVAQKLPSGPQGIPVVVLRMSTHNQHSECVLSCLARILVPCRSRVTRQGARA